MFSLVAALSIALVPLPSASAVPCFNTSSGWGFGPVELSCNWTCRNSLNVFTKWVNSDPEQDITVEARGWCDDAAPANERTSADNQVYCTDTDSNCEGWSTGTTSGTPPGYCWGKAHESWDSNNRLDCSDGVPPGAEPRELPPGGFVISVEMPAINDVTSGLAIPTATLCDGSGLRCAAVVPVCELDLNRGSIACGASTTSRLVETGAPAVEWQTPVA